MAVPIVAIYSKYLRGAASLDDLREWLALCQWGDLSADERGLIDEADVALAHLDDGFGDEAYVRLRLQLALEKYGTRTVSLFIPAGGANLLRPIETTSSAVGTGTTSFNLPLVA